MKSDTEIYRIFKSEVKALFELTGMQVKGNYGFKSVSVKQSAREMDAPTGTETSG